MFNVYTQDQKIDREFETFEEVVSFAMPQSREQIFIVCEVADDKRPWLLAKYHALVFDGMVWLPQVDEKGFSVY